MPIIVWVAIFSLLGSVGIVLGAGVLMLSATEKVRISSPVL
jgi:hypothetical protein